MSIFTIENQGVNTYIVYKVTAEDEFDSLSFGMLANNKIRGIAPILFRLQKKLLLIQRNTVTITLSSIPQAVFMLTKNSWMNSKPSRLR